MLNNCSPLPLKNDPEDKKMLPLNVEPLSTLSTTKPLSGNAEAVTLPLDILNNSCESAENGISNKNLPEPDRKLPDDKNILPLNVEPLISLSTKKPLSGDTEAVTLPLAIRNTSWDKADCGISNKPAPLPLKNEPDDKKILPLNVEPLSSLSTTNPLSGETDAVILPLAIKLEINTSSAKADLGISNKPLPLPLNIEAETFPAISTLPVNSEPLVWDITINPLSGDTEAVTLPLCILVAAITSSASADNGISNNCAPLPLKNPLVDRTEPNMLIEPVKCEPNEKLSTLNPLSSPTDAVTLPLEIRDEICASSVNAVLGILNNFSPLPLKNDPDDKKTLPLKVEPLSTLSTKNPLAGDTEAVTLPLAIRNTSCDNADCGMLNNPSPLPLKNDPDERNILPLKVEPRSGEITKNPVSGDTDAVTLPLAMRAEICASSVKADLGISNKSLPLPLNTLPLDNLTLPKNNDPLILDDTTNPNLSLTEAVTLPLAIKDDIWASSVRAVRGMLNKSLPLPLNTLPLANLKSPKNVDPLILEDTTNPNLSLTDALTLPLAIKGATSAGTLNKPLPSPLNEPVNEPVAEDAVTDVAISSVCICTEPVNCWISVIWSPKMLLPDE